MSNLLQGKVTSAYNYTPVGTAHKSRKGSVIVTLGKDIEIPQGSQLLIKEPKSEAVLFYYKKLTDKVYDTLAVDLMILARPELLAQHAAEIQKEEVVTAKAEPKIVKSLEDYAEIYKDYIAQHPELKGRKLLKAHREEILADKAINPEMDYSQTLANIETAMSIVLKADAEKQAQDAKKTSKKKSSKKTSKQRFTKVEDCDMGQSYCTICDKRTWTNFMYRDHTNGKLICDDCKEAIEKKSTKKVK
jgi:hypothetical protein